MRHRRVNHWWEPHEGSLNWLALGLLLAAWNLADDGGAQGAGGGAPRARAALNRPDSLRGYEFVSVRAARGGHFSPEGSQKRQAIVKLGISNGAASCLPAKPINRYSSSIGMWPP